MTEEFDTTWGTEEKKAAAVPAEERKRAVLAGLNTGRNRAEYDASMRELRALAEALGLVPAATMVQSAAAITQKTYIGSGKVQELLLLIEDCGADVVIFNEQLTPMQVRNLEDVLDTEVLDRTGIILQIFSERARTREARLQVASARLSYLLPRLAGMRKNLSRQGGGSGRLSNKGAGEEQLELDRRERSTQRAMRLRSGLPRVSLVGYTNAGKSTLLNALLALSPGADAEKKQVLEKDMLFATLDTQVRKISVPGHTTFLLSDTVGFLSDLPHALVKAFRSTLEEAKYADLLLEVVDSADPASDLQIQVTQRTLSEIGAGDIPVLFVLNKADRLPDITIPSAHGDRIYLSAKTGEGLSDLLDRIDETLLGRRVTRTYLVSYSEGKLLASLASRFPDAQQAYLEDGVRIALTLPRKEAEALASHTGVAILSDREV